MFLGGTSDIRPFGDAVLDGCVRDPASARTLRFTDFFGSFDLDLEGGGVTGDIAFVNKIRSLMDADKSKTYYITAAPQVRWRDRVLTSYSSIMQCPYPDLNLQSTLNVGQFDAVYVQFYNNGACSTTFTPWADTNVSPL